MSPTLLIVDDNPAMVQLIGRALHGLGQIRFAPGGEAALKVLRTTAIDLVLLDAEMPGLSGFQVLEAIKADPALAEVPVIFVTGHSEPEFEVRGLEAGAVDFIAKPVNPPLLQARVRTHLRLKRLADELRANATIDGLTEIANRRCLDQTLEREWKRMQRENGALSMLLVDVDYFKRYNDRYGHPAGDGCLRAVARVLREAARRPGDLVARYGGEEFALLLPKTGRAGAEHLAQVLLQAVQSLVIPHEASDVAAHVTVSIGVGCLEAVQIDSDMARLVTCADQALYAAKHGGRARGWSLDYSDTQQPERGREVLPAAVAEAAP